MVKINGELWEAMLVSPNHPKLRREDGTFSIGCCDDVAKKIYINDRLNSYYTKKVLCHELVHAAMYSYNVELDHDSEELIAEIIATYGEEIIRLTNTIFIKIKRGNL